MLLVQVHRQGYEIPPAHRRSPTDTNSINIHWLRHRI